MKWIKLSKGFSAKVDNSWYPYLSQWKWHFDGKYARRNENGKHIYLHKVVAGVDGVVDHKNLDTLNNQAENLRPATVQQNRVNSHKQDGCSSTYKGVSKCGNSWRTQIWYNNKKVYDACFPSERWAAMAYDLNAAALFSEYVRLNFPDTILVCSSG